MGSNPPSPAVGDPILPMRLVSVRDLALGFFIMSVVFYRVSTTVADPGLWGHVRFGLNTCLTGHIGEHDPYSYLSRGQRWINPAWLAEVFFALAFQVAGGTGLIAFKLVIVLLMLAWIYRDLWRQGLDALRGGLVLLVVAFTVYFGVSAVQPQLFTYLGFMVTLVILRRAEQDHLGWLWALPPVLVLWVNLHEGFVVGLLVLLVWWAVHLAVVIGSGHCDRVLLSRPIWIGALAVLASFLASLANPYGLDLPRWLLRAAAAAKPELPGYGPLSLVSAEGVFYLLLLVLVVLGLCFSRRRLDQPLLMVLLGMAMAPLLSVRHLPLFALSVPILAGAHIASAWEYWFLEKPLTGQTWRVVLPLAVGGLVTLAALPNLSCLIIDPHAGDAFPTRAVAWLRKCQAKGNMVVPVEWGAYVIWHLGPEVKVSVDGRRQAVYGNKVLAANLDFHKGLQDWDALLQRTKTDFVLVNRHYPVFNLMQLSTRLEKPKWQLIYEDHLCGLFVPQKSPWLEVLPLTLVPRVPIDGAGLCFPDHSPILLPPE